MSIEAMKQALEALEWPKGKWPDLYKRTRNATITALRAAIEQAEKPVAWMYEWDGRRHLTFTDQRFIEKSHPHFNKSTPLYTAPRQWQGLTEIEFRMLYVQTSDYKTLWQAIEAKLKEKNT